MGQTCGMNGENHRSAPYHIQAANQVCMQVCLAHDEVHILHYAVVFLCFESTQMAAFSQCYQLWSVCKCAKGWDGEKGIDQNHTNVVFLCSFPSRSLTFCCPFSPRRRRGFRSNRSYEEDYLLPLWSTLAIKGISHIPEEDHPLFLWKRRKFSAACTVLMHKWYWRMTPLPTLLIESQVVRFM